jgi:hypothetical protein
MVILKADYSPILALLKRSTRQSPISLSLENWCSYMLVALPPRKTGQKSMEKEVNDQHQITKESLMLHPDKNSGHLFSTGANRFRTGTTMVILKNDRYSRNR